MSTIGEMEEDETNGTQSYYMEEVYPLSSRT